MSQSFFRNLGAAEAELHHFPLGAEDNMSALRCTLRVYRGHRGRQKKRGKSVQTTAASGKFKILLASVKPVHKNTHALNN